MAVYDITTQTINVSGLKIGDIINCPYSGKVQSINLPKGQYQLEVWGAMGGYRSSETYAGKGGYAKGTLTTSKVTPFYLYSGGTGNQGGTSGGFNGGGARDSVNGGGGGSDIRLETDSLYARVIVAGGGGSDGASNKYGQYGGGETGGSSSESYGTGGGGGTQTAGGSGGNGGQNGTFGIGGKGIGASGGYGGGGGGGWYGGGGSYPDGSGDDDRGAGGGSGYIYTSSTATNYPSGCLLDSTSYLTDASMISGNTTMTLPSGSSSTGNNSSGYVRITILSIVEQASMYVKINGEWKPVSGISAKINNIWS